MAAPFSDPLVLRCELEAKVLPVTPQMSLKCGQQCGGCNHCWKLCDWVSTKANEELGVKKTKVLRAAGCSFEFVSTFVFLIGENSLIRRK